MRHSTFYERHAPSPSLVTASLADARLGAYWLDAAAGRRLDHPPLTGRVEADLVVVGGGFTGLWTAVNAVRRSPGLRVVVLEAARVAWAASGRNGGWIDYSITHGEHNGRSRWPAEFATLQRLGLENLDGLAADVEALGIDCDLERVGALMIAVEPHQVPWVAETDPDLPDARALDAAAARTRIHSDGILGAVAETGRLVATADPARLALGLAGAAERLGVRIYERSKATGLSDAPGGRVVVTANGGSVTAPKVALATNAFPSLLARTRTMTVPVYDYALMTEPLTSSQRASIGWAGREGLGDLANQFHYSQITPDGRILWGGYDAIYHPGGRIRAAYEDRPDVHARLAAHFFALFPQLEGVRFSHRWAGVIDTSMRFAAFTGTARRGRVAYAAGFTGLGVGTSRFAADTMLDLLSGDETERTSLEMVRRRGLPFPPEPAATIGIELSRRAMDSADHRFGRRGPFLRTMDALGLGFDS